jgi:hypothetical protein
MSISASQVSAVCIFIVHAHPEPNSSNRAFTVIEPFLTRAPAAFATASARPAIASLANSDRSISFRVLQDL